MHFKTTVVLLQLNILMSDYKDGTFIENIQCYVIWTLFI